MCAACPLFFFFFDFYPTNVGRFVNITSSFHQSLPILVRHRLFSVFSLGVKVQFASQDCQVCGAAPFCFCFVFVFLDLICNNIELRSLWTRDGLRFQATYSLLS